jgi:hypothetical protein
MLRNFNRKSDYQEANLYNANEMLDLWNRICLSLLRLETRLARPYVFQKVQLINVSPGTQPDGRFSQGITGGQVQIQQDFNGIIVDVTSGQINLAFGAVSNPGTGNLITQTPDLHFQVTSLPVYIPLPEKSDTVISLWADSAQAVNTNGTVFFVNY